MKFRIRKATTDADILAIRYLDRLLFPDDELIDMDSAVWWIVHQGDMPVAYAGIGLRWAEIGIVFMRRVGVIKSARGHGLQRRLIRTRLKAAKNSGYKMAITYTMPDNTVSSNNLIACGFSTYWPTDLHAGNDVIYWKKNLIDVKEIA